MILGPARSGRKEGTLTASLHAPRLLLIRHGQTAWNIQRRFLGRTDVPLDEVGLDQAARLARRLVGTRIDALWSSPLCRARQTAAVLGTPQVEPDLIEMDMGELEGLTGVEFQERYPAIVESWRTEPHAVRLPGGEAIDDVLARGLAAVRRIGAQVGPGETVAVVTHQLVLGAVVCHLSGAPMATFRKFMHRNTGITTIEFQDTARVLRVDDAEHLDG